VAPAGIAHAAPDPPPIPKTTIEADGSYTVGADIVSGTYSSAGPVADGVCYWKRLNGDTIVDNALTKKPQIVQIAPGDTAFVTNDCQPWQLTECPPECAPPAVPPQSLLGHLGDLFEIGP
jgi:hypothetical protein